jgi:hypothetical protein
MAKKWAFSAFILFAVMISCSEDDDNKITDKIKDVGEKWRISSAEYNIVDQTTSSMAFKTGTKEDAGGFYFDGTTGTFDILIGKWHEEDYFSFTENTGEINITSITQSAGSNISQSVIIISGNKDTETTMTIDGTITRQSTSGQFVMTATFHLVKE